MGWTWRQIKLSAEKHIKVVTPGRECNEQTRNDDGENRTVVCRALSFRPRGQRSINCTDRRERILSSIIFRLYAYPSYHCVVTPAPERKTGNQRASFHEDGDLLCARGASRWRDLARAHCRSNLRVGCK